VDLEALLVELENYGEKNDAEVTERSRRLLNITRETGEFLAVLIKATRAEHILEVGTSNGYSTLWLAAAIPPSGTVTTLEVLPHKIEQARHNFQKAGLQQKIKLVQTDAVEYFKTLNGQYDLIFLDAERTDYMKFAAEVTEALREGGLLVCDNAISHPSELIDFTNYIKGQPDFTTCLVPVGKGEFLACKDAYR
jgi:predicted O-methyltransferase YrrM